MQKLLYLKNINTHVKTRFRLKFVECPRWSFRYSVQTTRSWACNPSTKHFSEHSLS